MGTKSQLHDWFWTKVVKCEVPPNKATKDLIDTATDLKIQVDRLSIDDIGIAIEGITEEMSKKV